MDAKKKKIQNEARAEIPRSIAWKVRKLIPGKRCLRQSPDKRRTFEELQNDVETMEFEFFPDVNTEKVIRFVRKIESWEKDKRS
jgi:hypothetical protein